MSAGLDLTKFISWFRGRFDEDYNTALASSKLPSRVFVEVFDEVQQEISRVACLIKTCYHWPSVVGKAFYGLELTPALFRREYTKRTPCFYKQSDGTFRLLKWRGEDVLENLASQYTSNATPLYACLALQSGGKAIGVLPAPDTAAGDRTKANDPLRFYAWRLAKPISLTNGIPEIDGDLHHILKLGCQAGIADILKHPKVDLWQAEFETKLEKVSVVDGIRRPVKATVNNQFENVIAKELLSWNGTYDLGALD